MPTTEVVLQLGEHDDTIKKLSQELGVGDKTSTQNVASPMSASDTKPSVPTMTAPIPEYSQPEETGDNSDSYAIQEERQASYTNPYDIPREQTQHGTPETEPYVNTDPYAIQEPRQMPYTNPYDIPWT